MQSTLLKIKFGVFLTVLISSYSAFAQNSDSLKYDLDFQIGGQRKTGVFSQTAIRVTSNNHLEKEKWEFNNYSNYTYTEVNGGIIADDWDFRTILMFRSHLKARILPAIGHSFHSNVLYRVRNINRGIIGIRTIPFMKQTDFKVLIGGGYEHSNYQGEVFENSRFISSQRSFALGFANISGQHRLGKPNILLNYNLSMVQSMRERQDHWIWLTAGWSFPLGKVFSVGLNYDLRFRNVHLEDIPHVNDLLLFNVKISLSN